MMKNTLDPENLIKLRRGLTYSWQSELIPTIESEIYSLWEALLFLAIKLTTEHNFKWRFSMLRSFLVKVTNSSLCF